MIDLLTAVLSQPGPYWCVTIPPDYWPTLARYLSVRGCEYICVRLNPPRRREELTVLVVGSGEWAGSEILDRQAAGKWLRLWLHLRRRDEIVLSPGLRRVLLPQRQAAVTPGVCR